MQKMVIQQCQEKKAEYRLETVMAPLEYGNIENFCFVKMSGECIITSITFSTFAEIFVQ